MVFLEVNNIVKRYDSSIILNGVNLRVREGELVVILGPSGCGKTTTLRIIAGTLVPDGGKILLEGEDITFLPPWERNIGFVYQNLALFPHLTVKKNIAFVLETRSWPLSRIERRVKELVKLLRLDGLEDRYPAQLSGGQQQSVAIARALAPYPRLLLMDEPFSNLDALLREEFRQEIRDLVKDLNITTIFVTHDQTEAFQIADKVGIMFDGKIVQFGKPGELLTAPISVDVAKFLKLNVLRVNNHYLVFSPSSVELFNHGEEFDFEARVIKVMIQPFLWRILLETLDGQKFEVISSEPPRFKGNVKVKIHKSVVLED